MADLSKPITVDPDTGGVQFESDMPRGAGMPLRQLPRPEEVDEDDGQRQPPSRMPSVSQAGSDLVWGGADGVARAQAQLDTAMVMTFGAVAASKLPPKRRPRLDPRVLDSLLNGTPCDYASSCAPLAPHCAPCVWSQVSTCHRRRPRTTCSRRTSRRTGGLQLRRARCRSSSWSRVVLRQGARTSRWSSRRHSRGNAEFKGGFCC